MAAMLHLQAPFLLLYTILNLVCLRRRKLKCIGLNKKRCSICYKFDLLDVFLSPCTLETGNVSISDDQMEICIQLSSVSFSHISPSTPPLPLGEGVWLSPRAESLLQTISCNFPTVKKAIKNVELNYCSFPTSPLMLLLLEHVTRPRFDCLCVFCSTLLSYASALRFTVVIYISFSLPPRSLEFLPPLNCSH